MKVALKDTKVVLNKKVTLLDKVVLLKGKMISKGTSLVDHTPFLKDKVILIWNPFEDSTLENIASLVDIASLESMKVDNPSLNNPSLGSMLVDILSWSMKVDIASFDISVHVENCAS